MICNNICVGGNMQLTHGIVDGYFDLMKNLDNHRVNLNI